MIIKPEELMEAPVWGSRMQLPGILTNLGLLGVGVEIGVQRGVFGSHIRANWDGEKYIGVDPWLKYFSVLDTQAMHDQYREDAFMNLGATNKPFELIRKTAMDALPDLKKAGPFDWIFVDGDHSYKAVMEEIEHLWPLVRPGGIFAAHDWVDDGWHRNGDPTVAFPTEEQAGGEVGHCGIFEVKKAFYECFPVNEYGSITSPNEDWGWQSIMFRKAL